MVLASVLAFFFKVSNAPIQVLNFSGLFLQLNNINVSPLKQWWVTCHTGFETLEVFLELTCIGFLFNVWCFIVLICDSCDCTFSSIPVRHQCTCGHADSHDPNQGVSTWNPKQLSHLYLCRTSSSRSSNTAFNELTNTWLRQSYLHLFSQRLNWCFNWWGERGGGATWRGGGRCWWHGKRGGAGVGSCWVTK